MSLLLVRLYIYIYVYLRFPALFLMKAIWWRARGDKVNFVSLCCYPSIFAVISFVVGWFHVVALLLQLVMFWF